MEQANGRWWFKYSPEFKRQAVDRMTAGECVSALTKELGVGRRFLYAWPENGYGSADPQPPMRGVKRQQAEASASERPAASLKKRISELERLVGRQAAELDFFRRSPARHRGESRPSSGGDSGNESTPSRRARPAECGMECARRPP